jgi:hypothetical protein
MNPTISVVVGTRIPKEQFSLVEHPKIIDGMDNDLVAFDGGEYDHDSVIIGEMVHYYDGYTGSDVLKNVMSEFASKRVEVDNLLEEEFGIDREVSIYLVGEKR